MSNFVSKTDILQEYLEQNGSVDEKAAQAMGIGNLSASISYLRKRYEYPYYITNFKGVYRIGRFATLEESLGGDVYREPAPKLTKEYKRCYEKYSTHIAVLCIVAAIGLLLFTWLR